MGIAPVVHGTYVVTFFVCIGEPSLSISLQNHVSCVLRINQLETFLEPLTSKLLVAFVFYVFLACLSQTRKYYILRDFVHSHHSSLAKQA